jgi:FkbM family methyltransferase
MNLKLFLHHITYALLTRRCKSVETLGTRDQWTILPDLCSDSFIVSAGAGTDISFELALLERFGCTVVLLDPSTPGLRCYESLNPTPPRLHYLPFGLASSAGKRLLYPPDENADTTSWTITGNSKGHAIDCLDLTAVLHRFQRDSIDLLKIDIEGFEYEVLDGMLKSGIYPRQICVEIHQGHLFMNRTRRDRWKLIFKLLSSGYGLVHHHHSDHLFVRRSLLAKQGR